jgi:DNA-binding ferritin-like protein
MQDAAAMPLAKANKETVMSINMGLSDTQREAMASAVTAVLADTYALYFKTHVYH